VKAGEKGDTTTILPVFNAMGEIGTLMVIFEGKRIKPEWAVGSPCGTLIQGSKDGWINKDQFLELGHAFVKKPFKRWTKTCSSNGWSWQPCL